MAKASPCERWAGVKAADCSPEEIESAHRAGYEPGPDGYFVGRDPREMTTDEILAIGHEQMSQGEAIRAKCLDCCAGSPHEVRLCVAMACPSWPFRMGKNPWRTPMSEERRAQMRERGFAGKRSPAGERGEGDRTSFPDVRG